LPAPWIPSRVVPPFSLAGLALLAGCGREADVRPGDVRTYEVAKEAPRPPVTREEPASAAGPKITYDVPDGWTDRGAGGMRLATLAIGDPTDRREVTIIPASGSLRSNVARWHGQLHEAASEQQRDAAVDAALAAAEEVDVAGTKATVVLLLDPEAAASADGGEAILGAMIPVEGSSSLFVKFKGDAAVARRERESFARFVSTIRWK
jgi:hypothetical protein